MTVHEIIELFGTQEKAAQAAQVTQSAVSQWLGRDQIPAARQRLLLKAAHEKNINLEPADFFEGLYD
jgi:predicted transcriptional regulator